MIDPSIAVLLWETPPGEALFLRILGTGVLLACLAIGGPWLWAAVPGGAAAIWSFAEIGHIAGRDRFWLRIVLFVHLAAAAFWIGVFLPLRRLSRAPETMNEAAASGLARSISLEWLCVGLILLATAIFTSVLTVPA